MNNDRFNFRLHDKKNNYRIDDDGEYLIDSCGILYWFCGDCLHYKDDDFIKLQCTGIKDKRNNLIYESDIIRAHFPFDGELSAHHTDFIVVYVGYDDFKNYEPMIWDRFKLCTPGFYLRLLKEPENKRLFIFSYSENVDYEVIGNIYENYELEA